MRYLTVMCLQNGQLESVPSLLISLISLILEGRSVDRKSVDENKTELNELIADITVERCRAKLNYYLQ